MKKTLASLMFTASLALAGGALAADESHAKADVEHKDNGGYTATRSEKATVGNVDKTLKTEVDVDVDSDGKKSRTVTSKSTNDPSGLMNKSSKEGETTIEEKANGGYKQTTVREGVDSKGTSVYYKTVTDVEIDGKGNVTTTATTDKTTDPKGLFNKTSTSTKVKTVNGKVVENSTDHD